MNISARRDSACAGAIEVVVRDEGPGVPQKDLALIFEPFYRVDTAREHRSAGGEGLGLAIAARAIAVHGGRICRGQRRRRRPDGERQPADSGCGSRGAPNSSGRSRVAPGAAASSPRCCSASSIELKANSPSTRRRRASQRDRFV